MTTGETRAAQLGKALVAAIEADRAAAGLTVAALAERTGIPRGRLARRLSGAGLRAGELEALALALGRRPSEWMVQAEQAVEQPHI